MISTKTHGVLDYSVGLLLVLSPWLFGFSDVPAARWTIIVLGLAALIYSLCTDYELGAFSLLPISVHLGLDFCSGLILAASPWLFGFAGIVYLPHLLFGILEVAAAIMTRRAVVGTTARA
jgi:hypothetical protein